MRLLLQCLGWTVAWLLVSVAAGLLVARVFVLGRDAENRDV